MTEQRAANPNEAELDLTVVAPAHNEEGNVAELVRQVGEALEPTGLSYEFILVDDGSTDRTRAVAVELAGRRAWLRVIGMLGTPAERGNGQSAAFAAGFAAARGRLIAVLDADLQNDPGDIPRMLAHLDKTGADFVQGDRTRARKDNFVRRRASGVGRLFRRVIVGDTIRDTGCSLRVMRREIALRLPLELRGMHRFIPATARHMGYTVVELPVGHRARNAGQTKYGSMGITKRALPGLVDCFAVRYLNKRRRATGCEEVTPAQGDNDAIAEPKPQATNQVR